MASRAQRNIKSISYAKYGYMFILPFFLVYAVFSLYPLLYTFFLSVKDNTAENFVGFENFDKILFGGSDFAGKSIHQSFTTALGNTFIVWIGNFLPQIVLSLLLAVWFTDSILNIRGRGFFKVVMYMPNIITAASIAALFLKLFGNSDTSVFNALFYKQLHWIDEPVLFLNDKGRRFTIIAIIQAWMWYGNTMILIISGILGISPSLYEAANIDGANSKQTFFRVTLPLLRPIMVYTVITSMIGGLQMFDIPLMYNVGQTVDKQYMTIAVYVYNFYTGTTKKYGISAAASVILFVITAILGSFVFMMNRDADEVAAKKRKKAMIKQAKQKKNSFGGLDI